MIPLVPPIEAASLKMTPVQGPATGYRTSALPKLPTPCGSEDAASRPRGSTRMNRTRALHVPPDAQAAAPAADAG